MAAVQPAVHDMRVMQPADVRPQRLEEVEAPVLGWEIVQTYGSRERTFHQQRRARTGTPRDDHLRNAYARVTREQRDIRLAFNVVLTGPSQAWSRVLVHHEPPHLREETRVSLVASDHLDPQRTVFVDSDHSRKAELLVWVEPDSLPRRRPARQAIQ